MYIISSSRLEIKWAKLFISIALLLGKYFHDLLCLSLANCESVLIFFTTVDCV